MRKETNGPLRNKAALNMWRLPKAYVRGGWISRNVLRKLSSFLGRTLLVLPFLLHVKGMSSIVRTKPLWHSHPASGPQPCTMAESSVHVLLSHCDTKNDLIKQIRALVTQLCFRGLSVCLCWVPSHNGFLGNELAGYDAWVPLAWKESCLGIPHQDVIPELKKAAYRERQKESTPCTRFQ